MTVHDDAQPQAEQAAAAEGQQQEQRPSDPPPTAEEVAARRAVQLEVWRDQQQAQLETYGASEPTTLRQRLAWAKELAEADVLPTRYRKKPANVLVAFEVGQELGLPRMASLRLLNVVENQPTLGAEGVRAVIRAAGHDLWEDADASLSDQELASGWWTDPHTEAGLVRNRNGVPMRYTLCGQRAGSERVVRASFRLTEAESAGLCTLVRDDDGEVCQVIARSDRGNALPWETYTADMLHNRATTRLGRRAFSDVVGGLSYERDELEGIVTSAPAPAAAAPPRLPAPEQERGVGAALTRPLPPPAEPDVPTIRRTDFPDGWEPDDDVKAAGAEWWQHAGATVRRRSPMQLAADRLALALGEGNADVPLPPADAELRPAVAHLVQRGRELITGVYPDATVKARTDDVAEAVETLAGVPVVHSETTTLPPADVETVEDALAAVQELAGVPGGTTSQVDDGPPPVVTYGHREPYVGEGAEGARRSAEIDRTEADTVDRDTSRHAELLASAEAWEQQAADLEAGVDTATGEVSADPAADAELAELDAGVAGITEGDTGELAAPPREALWLAVENLAGQRGKTVAQLLHRTSLAERQPVDELSDEALARFLRAQGVEL